MSAEQNKAEIARWADAYNEGDLEKLDQLAEEQSTADYVLHGSKLTRGPEGMKQSVRSFATSWSDMHVTIDDLVADGDKVASRWTVRGIHRNQQKRMTLTLLAISRFVDGKIAEEWVVGRMSDE